MKRGFFAGVIVLAFLFFHCSTLADAVKTEWLGEWTVNYDGVAGTLYIIQSRARAGCAEAPWCDMAMSYGDSKGKYSASIERIDDNWQHMTFYVDFARGRQRFDAYLFSSDKSKMAGTTYRDQGTFGFYATKRQLTRGRSTVSLKDLSGIIARIKPARLLSERANPPVFIVDGKAFAFYQGDRPTLGSDSTKQSRKLISILLARIMQVEDLRLFIAQRPEANPAFWDPYFQKALEIEQKMASVLALENQTEALERMASLDSAINRIFQEEAPKDFGRVFGLEFRKPNLISFAKHLVPVSFSLDPQSGQLSVVDETSYLIAQTCRETGACPGDVEWRAIREANPRLGGWYYYKVEWPDGSTTTALILVERPGTEFRIAK